jgi:hypothetical protein
MPIQPKFGNRKFGQTLQNIPLWYDKAQVVAAYTGGSGIQPVKVFYLKPKQLIGLNSITVSFDGYGSIGTTQYWYVSWGPYTYSPAPGMLSGTAVHSYSYLLPVKDKAAGMDIIISYNGNSNCNAIVENARLDAVGKL